ncbi:hypothetical protein HAX54_012812, partial [Datura stramonium]|nr:hypothetical protein [Datura stramonium]
FMDECTEWSSLVNRQSVLIELRMKRQLRYKASGHYLRPAFYRRSTGQHQKNAGVAPDDP